MPPLEHELQLLELAASTLRQEEEREAPLPEALDEPEASQDAPLQCGKRGMTYQPSRRKRVNSHGLEKR